MLLQAQKMPHIIHIGCEGNDLANETASYSPDLEWKIICSTKKKPSQEEPDEHFVLITKCGVRRLTS